MSGKRTWSHVGGSIACELAWADGKVWDITHDRELPDWIAPWHDRIQDGDVLCIDFESSGYYDPGVCSGPPEKCFPPERDEERLVMAVYIRKDGGRGDLMDLVSVRDMLAELYEKEIDSAELEDET